MKRIAFILTVFFMTTLAFGGGLSQIYIYDAGFFPRGIEIADLNGDNKNDVIVANFGEDTLIGQENDKEPTSSVSFYESTGETTLAGSFLSAGTSPRGLAAGDINNDKKQDFVVSNYDDGTIMIFEQGAAGLAMKQVIEVGKHPVGVAIGDLDSSGEVQRDVAVAVYSESKIAVLIRNPKGAWEKTDVTVPGNPTDVVIGKINGEKILVSANYSAGTISIIKKVRNEMEKTQDIATGGGVCKVSIADVTGDGVNDIVAANFHDNTVSVIEYKNGEAVKPVTYKLKGSRPNGMATGDINGDGLTDVVTANRDSDTIDILVQKEGGLLVLEKTFAVTDDEDKTYGPVEIVVGDVNNDGTNDIAFSHMRSNTLRVIYQEAEEKECEPAKGEAMNEKNVYNYPNPCSDRTTIRFSLDVPKDVKVIVMDIKGKVVWQYGLPEAEAKAGTNYIVWNLVNDLGGNIANGTYILKVITGDTVITKKIAVIK